MPKPTRRKRRSPVAYELVVHSKHRSRTLNSKYVHLKNACNGGGDRCLRGADWFEVYEIRPERKVCAGSMENGKLIIVPSRDTRVWIRDEFPIHWRKEPE